MQHDADLRGGGAKLINPAIKRLDDAKRMRCDRHIDVGIVVGKTMRFCATHHDLRVACRANRNTRLVSERLWHFQ